MANTKKKLDFSSCLPVCFYNKTAKRKKKITIQPQSRHGTYNFVYNFYNMLHCVLLNLKAYFCCVAIKKRSQKERRVARTRQQQHIIIKQHPQRLASQNRLLYVVMLLCCPNYKTNNNINSRKNARAFLFFTLQIIQLHRRYIINYVIQKILLYTKYIHTNTTAAYSKISRKIPAHTEW